MFKIPYFFTIYFRKEIYEEVTNESLNCTDNSDNADISLCNFFSASTEEFNYSL